MFEKLEQRRLLATVVINAGVLEVTGDGTPDTIDITVDVPNDDVFVDINGSTTTLALSDVTTGVLVNAGAGNDTVTFGANTGNATINGEA